jgi:hypothetical protein
MKKTKVISVVITNQFGEFKGDYTLKFKKTKNGETEGILTIPYIEWYSPESCELAFRVLTIKGRELECIEKYYFDENLFTIPIRDCPYTIDMCDILYKVMPPEIYIQMISGTFTMKEYADNEIYAHYFQLEKENKDAIGNFINEQKKLRGEIDPKTILYARKPNAPPSSGDNLSVILINKLSKNDKYKVQIYLMSESGKEQIFMESEFDDIYIAKKFYDSFEYKDKDVLNNPKRFNSLIADFTKNKVIKADDSYKYRQEEVANKQNLNDEEIIPKIKEILKEELPSDIFSNLFESKNG